MSDETCTLMACLYRIAHFKRHTCTYVKSTLLTYPEHIPSLVHNRFIQSSLSPWGGGGGGERANDVMLCKIQWNLYNKVTFGDQ